jgi:hypothetical protein
MLNLNEPDGHIDRVMDKLKQDIVDLTANDASSAADDVATLEETEETEEAPAGEAVPTADAVTARVSRSEEPAALSEVPSEVA